MIIRNICGLEWRVHTPSGYILNSFADDRDCTTVYYDGEFWRYYTAYDDCETAFATREDAMRAVARNYVIAEVGA